MTNITIPRKPTNKPNSWSLENLSPIQKKAIVRVSNAVDEFNIANILESDPYEASENITNGIALLNTARNKIYGKVFLNSALYFFCKSIGKNINDAKASRDDTKKIEPSSGVAILINMNALPQIAPKTINNNQYRNSI